MEKSITQLLKAVKDSPELGKLDSVCIESARVRLMERIAKTSAPASAPTFIDVLRAPFHGMEVRSFVQPFAAVGVVFAFAVSWVGSVVASMNSVPGDRLYGLKIASEHIQLSFADSADSKARLHVEFANRRAEEVSRLIEKNSDEVQVKVAMVNLKSELQNVSNHLSTIKDDTSVDAVSLAKYVDRKVGSLEATIDSSLDGANDAVKQEATEVKDVVKVASVQALTVLATEDGAKSNSAASLDKKVVSHLEEVRAALKSAKDDADTVQTAFAERVARLPILSDADRKLAEELKKMKADLTDAEAKLTGAEASAGKKEYAEAMRLAASADEVSTKAQARLKEVRTTVPTEPEAKTEEKSDKKEGETKSDMPKSDR